jgi:hypothetical protein
VQKYLYIPETGKPWDCFVPFPKREHSVNAMTVYI